MKWLPTAGNNFQIFGSVPFGWNYCLQCTLTACMHNIFMLQLTFEIWYFRPISSGEDLLYFLKTKAFARSSTEILVFTPWLKMPIAAFSVNRVCPFKYRTRHAEIEQNSDSHLAWRKIKKENKMPLINREIAWKQSLYNDLFTKFRKNTLRMWKTTEKWRFIS